MRAPGRVAVLVAAALGAGPSLAVASEFGAKAGASIANLVGTSSISPSSVTGLTGGVFLSLGDGPFGLEADVLFTAKGYRFATTVAGTVMTVVNEFNYIDVPVLIKCFVIPTGPFRPYLGVGPQISFLMSARSKTDLNGARTTEDVKSAMANYDYSAVVDGGVTIHLGLARISADFRYALGLTGVSRASSLEGKNSVISVIGGLAF